VKWNGIGRSNNPAHNYAQSWKGTGISETEKDRLISKIRSQPASVVYNDLLSRPTPQISYYGTCMVGIVRGMPTFWVQGMYGSHGRSGYPKNPISGDGTGHLQGCYNEHQVTGLCSYSDVAERAKQTLLYAVKNDVCTNYYNLNSPTSPSSSGLCGNYLGATISSIKGNDNVSYSVVKIRPEHLSDPSMHSATPTERDNTMTTTTACAFDKMASAAAAADDNVKITIASGFRTVARQQYFWNCSISKTCNGGNKAAPPGKSKHGTGVALDLNTNCGKQTGAKPKCDGSRVYQWLKNNAHNYGFKRTVQSEPWHWEYVGDGATPATFT
jgi:hypothetical protein